MNRFFSPHKLTRNPFMNRRRLNVTTRCVQDSWNNSMLKYFSWSRKICWNICQLFNFKFERFVFSNDFFWFDMNNHLWKDANFWRQAKWTNRKRRDAGVQTSWMSPASNINSKSDVDSVSYVSSAVLLLVLSVYFQFSQANDNQPQPNTEIQNKTTF